RAKQSRRSVQKMIFSVHAPTRKNLIDAIAPRFLGCRTASERLEEHLRAAGVPIPEQAAPSFRNDAVHRYEIAFTPGGAWPGGAVFSRVEQEFLDMCDYSLHSVRTRPAKVGEKLVTHNFGTGTRGFAAPEDCSVAVCVLPGTELAFEAPVKYQTTFKLRANTDHT